MNREEIAKKFEENVEYLRRNVPPDDIYIFAEQTFMSALYFLSRWHEHVNLQQEIKENDVSKKWISNILFFQECKEKKVDVTLDLNLDFYSESD